MKPILEFAMFNAKPGVSDDAVIKAAQAIQTDLAASPGYLKRELFRGDGQQWLDLVYWRSLNDVTIAAEKIMSGSNWPTFEAVLDATGGRMIHAQQQIAFGNVETTQLDRPPVIDVVLFKTLPGVTDAQNLNVAEMLQPIIQAQKGYIKLELFKSDDGQWVEIVYWESSEAARAGNENVMASPEMSATFEVLDPENTEVLHLRRVMAFAPEIIEG